MSIENDLNVPISYECSDLIEDVRTDMRESRRTKKVYACCMCREGVKIIFDYIYDIHDKEMMKNYKPLSTDEWYEKMSYAELLAYLLQQNSLTNYYEDFVDLFEATGWTISDFACYFEIPERTVQDWIYGKTACSDYLIKLMNYRLVNENRI